MFIWRPRRQGALYEVRVMNGPGKRMSRRKFLGVASAAAAAAPQVLTSAALGQRSTPPASDRVTAAIIGCGRSGAYWMEGYYRQRQFQFISVCDVDSERADRVRARIERREKGTKVVRDFREVLADDSVDAVVIATPDHWHAVIACAAARANKDIYCESPISLTVREARQIERVSARYGRIFQAGLSHRYHSTYRRACGLIRDGALGKIQKIYASCGSPSQYCTLGATSSKCPDTLDWDLWQGPAPRAPYHPNRCSSSYSGWRAFREYSGGSLAYNGASVFDIVQWVLGADATGPVEFVPPKRVGEETIPLTLRYADGTTVIGARGPHEGSVEFVGEKGSLALGVGTKGFQTWPDNLADGAATDGPAHRKFNADPISDFRDCVRTRNQPLADAESACRSATIAHLACIAFWAGRTIKWDPVQEEVVNDDLAARWLDRPKRSPWRC